MSKILFDRTISFIAFLFLLVPVFIPVWLLINLTSKGGAIYSQIRTGKGCKPFKLYKFRSMVIGSDKQGFQTQKGDARITPVGRFIRKTSLDELPQLFNVLIGDMSLVGPRPNTPAQQASYSKEEWKLRHSVRPGITGLAQVNGRSDITLEAQTAYDLEYAKHVTFWRDMVILLRTVRVAVGSRTN